MYLTLFFGQIMLFKEKFKFVAPYWVPSAGAEATGGKVSSAEGMHNYDVILITHPEGW